MIRPLLLIILQTTCCKASDSRYECGEHGRFEYCVDDIPGCVVGCHCHPGFYFDTNSKICEPNTKLTQHYRRNDVSEPSRRTMASQTETQITETTSKAPNPVDAKIDEITKDADDLGDWLYNQFFKTIENQVINKTASDGQLTRRSAHPIFGKKPHRRSRKLLTRDRWGKKKRTRKGNLKKKLLRITEDDSLFDSSSSDSSSSDTSSSSSSSDSVSEIDINPNRDHGHKKLVVLSKKPRPPLPSFIFLPNMDTPFYPPIGLPPPPPVPMYPFVPVPPIGPFVVVTAKPEQENKTQSSTSGNATTAESTVTTSTTTTETSNKEGDDEAGQTETTTKTVDRKGRSKKMKQRMHPKSRNKLLQKFKQKLKSNTRPPTTDYMDYQDLPDSRFVNIGIPRENLPPNLMDEEMPKNEVDFRYLSQLIHRPDKNMNNLPPPRNRQINPLFNNAPADNYPPAQTNTLMNTRRQFNTIDKPEDSFYANLGRQIASVIRNMDTEGQQQINIEIEKPDRKPSTLPLFFENVYSSPRSYWERSVRSPINNYIKELEHIKRSNENLFSLENKAEIETRKYSLSLQEIENIVRAMDMAKSDLSNRKQNMAATNKNLKFNLLHHLYNGYVTEKNTAQSNKIVSVDNIKYRNKPLPKFKDNNNIEFLKLMMGLPMTEKMLGTNTSKTLSKINTKHQEFGLKKNFAAPNHIPKSTVLQTNNTSVLGQKYEASKMISFPKPTILKSKLKYHSNQTARRLNFQHFFGDDNQYEYEKTLYPVVLPNVRRSYKYAEKLAAPSYFHHELHHFDYFD